MADIERGTRESSFTNADGKKIFCRYWCEDLENPKAVVFISHGASEHCLWYTPLALQLKAAGCYVFSHDHVGHGQSEGDRVHVEDFHEYVRDLYHHFDQVSEQFPKVPKFIIGHSMGGTISIIAAIERLDFLDGVILIAPAVVPDPNTVTPFKLWLACQIAKWLPQATLTWMDSRQISRNTYMVTRYRDDPLVYHGGLKARWGASFLKWLQWIEANWGTLRCPILAMHGSDDTLTAPSGSQQLIDNVASKDKTFKLYQDHFHQLHWEPGFHGERARQDVVNWLTARCPAK